MIIDKQEHKQAILELIASATFSGAMVEAVYELKKTVEDAQIAEQAQNPSHD